MKFTPIVRTDKPTKAMRSRVDMTDDVPPSAVEAISGEFWTGSASESRKFSGKAEILPPFRREWEILLEESWDGELTDKRSGRRELWMWVVRGGSGLRDGGDCGGGGGGERKRDRHETAMSHLIRHSSQSRRFNCCLLSWWAFFGLS